MSKRLFAILLALSLAAASADIGSFPAWAQAARTQAPSPAVRPARIPAGTAGPAMQLRGATLNTLPPLASPAASGFAGSMAISQAQPAIGAAALQAAAAVFPAPQAHGVLPGLAAQGGQEAAASRASAAAPWTSALADPTSVVPSQSQLSAMPLGSVHGAGYALMDALLGGRSIRGGSLAVGEPVSGAWGALRGSGMRVDPLSAQAQKTAQIPPPMTRAPGAMGAFAMLSWLGLPEWMDTMISASLVLGGTWLVASLARRIVRRLSATNSLDPLLKAWIVRGAGLAVWGIGIFAALGIMGVSASLLAANTGLYGAAAGLAVKDALKKIFDGWRFFSSRPFKPGDWVKLNFTESAKEVREEGLVAAMNGRFVTLDISQNPSSSFERVLIPNELLLPELVYNKTAVLSGAAFLGGWGAKLAPAGLVFAKLTATVAGTYLATRLAGALVRRAAKKAALDKGRTQWLVSVSKALGYALGGLVLMHVAGISLSWLVTSLGILSIGIGYLMSEFANDAVAGAILALYRPFKAGDVIQVAGVEGRVVDITFRYVKLEVPEGWTVSIPSFSLIQKRIYAGKKVPAAPAPVI